MALLRVGTLERELFCAHSALDNGIPKLLGERIFCQLFGCKDFRGMILPPSMIRVRQSWDTEARVFARRRNTFSRQAVAPLGGVLNDTVGVVRFAARRTT